MLSRLLLTVGLLSVLTHCAASQDLPIDSADLRGMVAQMKEDPMGPFQSIRWFCADGTINPADEPCDSIGGVRHGLHKDFVAQIARHYGIYLGQILAGTDFDAFLDIQRFFSRAKQYQLEKYLERIDDGWIMRQARSYDGAVVAEDEADWGRRFLLWACADDELLSSQFFIIRQLANDIPHAQSLADSTMRSADIDSLSRYLFEIPEGSIVWSQLNALVDNRVSEKSGICSHIADMLWTIRLELPEIEPDWRLAMIDLSLSLEPILMHQMMSWHPATARGLLEKNETLARASAGCGYLGIWEWRDLQRRVSVQHATGAEDAAAFMDEVDAARHGLDWGITMVRAQYEPVERRFTRFELLARGFVDDRLRSTILAPFAETVDELTRKISTITSSSSDVPGLSVTGRLYGATTGLAVGTLDVITSPDSAVSYAPDVIYALTVPPADTVSLAGVIEVTSGAVMSPDPLVRRTTGIPSAVMTTDSLTRLAEQSGTRVLFAVSPRGRVVLKAAGEMTAEEMTLAGEQRQYGDSSAVKTTAVDLGITHLVALDSLGLHASGRICGPNITRLAQLESVFPDLVRPGFVIPFGVFRDHLDEEMPRVGMSYRTFFEETFDKAQQWRQDGELEAVINRFVLMRLSQLAEGIRSMPVRGEFHDELRRVFDRLFNGPLGTVPVIVRGDVNLDEDARERVGAGPDVGMINAISEAAVLQGIKDVWASVFSETGYGRRLRLLSDPGSLLPSVLVQTAIDVEKSGAVVMEGLSTLGEDDVTALFSPGAGGIETGPWPETFLLAHDGRDILLAPTRESHFMVLSPAGGIEEGYSAVFAPVLNATERLAIRYLTTALRGMPPATNGFESGVTYVFEMGFGEGNVWLLQTIPLSQYARGRLDAYFAELDRTLVPSGTIELDVEFPPAPAVVDTSSTGASADSTGGAPRPESSVDKPE